MPDQPYSLLTSRSQDQEWLNRVKACILHTAVNVKIKAAPTANEANADALGRSVVANPDLWTKRFAPVVAVILIGEADLTAANVLDAELFSAVDVAWAKFYEQPEIV